jgi:deoxyribonuclease V
MLAGGAGWPTTVDELVAVQEALGTAEPAVWHAPPWPTVAGCFVCFPRGRSGPGVAGDPGWAGAAGYDGRRCVARATVRGAAAAPYRPGLLALRVGPLLDAAVRALPATFDVLLVDATGSDHPRRAGLARHLGAVLGMPTVGVTHRPLLATGDWPADDRGAMSPLRLDGAVVGFWLRTRAGRRPLAVHAGWRTDPATAARIVLGAARQRTPAPLREARRLARQARAAA